MKDNTMITYYKGNTADNAVCNDIKGVVYKNLDYLLDHEINGQKLRSFITQTEVTDRNI